MPKPRLSEACSLSTQGRVASYKRASVKDEFDDCVALSEAITKIIEAADLVSVPDLIAQARTVLEKSEEPRAVWDETWNFLVSGYDDWFEKHFWRKPVEDQHRIIKRLAPFLEDMYPGVIPDHAFVHMCIEAAAESMKEYEQSLRNTDTEGFDFFEKQAHDETASELEEGRKILDQHQDYWRKEFK